MWRHWEILSQQSVNKYYYNFNTWCRISCPDLTTTWKWKLRHSVGTVTHRKHKNLGMHEWQVWQTRQHNRRFGWQQLRRSVFRRRRVCKTRVWSWRRRRDGFEDWVEWRRTRLCVLRHSTVRQFQHFQQLFLLLLDYRKSTTVILWYKQVLRNRHKR